MKKLTQSLLILDLVGIAPAFRPLDRKWLKSAFALLLIFLGVVGPTSMVMAQSTARFVDLPGARREGITFTSQSLKQRGAERTAQAGARALFNLDDPAIGPFPSDQFTVADNTQITGRRVNLPAPDCTARPTDCQDIAVLNALDGPVPRAEHIAVPALGA